MSPSPFITATPQGLFCAPGGFHIDPWEAVDRAIITHAHSDHVHWQCKDYLCARDGVGVLAARLGTSACIRGVAYGEQLDVNGVSVSLHPAGHILGSSQVRLEHRGEVWVVSGDYKVQPDATCRPFELVRCHTFITESTFGLPVYRWPPQEVVLSEVDAWWRQNQERRWTSIVFTYALGKAQRLIAGIDRSIGPIVVHGAVARFLAAYEAAGVVMPTVVRADGENLQSLRGRALVVAPPSVAGSPWLRKFAPYSTAFASGWMRIRGTRRWRSADRGFVLSDHADWEGLLGTIRETGATRIGVTHGYTGPLTRYLSEQGYEAWALPTRYGDEDEPIGGPKEAESSATAD